MTDQTRLKRLRAQVRGIDADIVYLLGRRFQLTNQIGMLKKMLGRPILDHRVEARVRRQTLALGRHSGLNPEVIQALYDVILSGSRLSQQVIFDQTRRGRPECILIVGGFGAMGRWFARFLRQRGHQVEIYDPRALDRGSWPSLEHGLHKTTMVMIACPMDVVASVINRLSELRYSGIVFDIASVKAPIQAAIVRARRRGMAIASIHPMFGPMIRPLEPKIVCLCDCGSAEAMHRLQALFRGPQIRLVKIALARHDRLIAYSLVLAHAINIVFARILVQSGLPITELCASASTTFRRQIETTRSVVGENPRLYYSIQRLNPFRRRLYRQLQSVVAQLAELILEEKEKPFRQFMTDCDQRLSKSLSRTRRLN